MSNLKELKLLIICIIFTNILAGIIYGIKNNAPGAFNCLCWGGIAFYVLMNVKTIFGLKDD